MTRKLDRTKTVVQFPINSYDVSYDLYALNMPLKTSKIYIQYESNKYPKINIAKRSFLDNIIYAPSILKDRDYIYDISFMFKKYNNKLNLLGSHSLKCEYLDLHYLSKNGEPTNSSSDKTYEVRYLCPDDEEIIRSENKKHIEFVRNLFKESLDETKINAIINAINVDGFLNCFSEYLMFMRIEQCKSETHIALTEREVYNDIINYFPFDIYQNIDINSLTENQKLLMI